MAAIEATSATPATSAEAAAAAAAAAQAVHAVMEAASLAELREALAAKELSGAPGRAARVEVVHVEGMGLCCRTCEAVHAGETLFVEEAFVVVEGATNTRMDGPIMEWARRQDLERDYDLDVVVEHFRTLADDIIARSSDNFEAHADAKEFVEQTASIAKFACSIEKILPAQENDLARYIRILTINACEAKALNAIALFDLFSKLPHSCEPNATFRVRPDAVVVVRASQDIPAGALVSISYLPSAAFLLAPTYYRRELLRIQKQFLCRCARCMRPDTSRIVQCPSCTGFRLRSESGTWLCSCCTNSLGDDGLCLDEESQLLDLVVELELSGYFALPPLWSLLACTEEVIGRRHYVCFLTLLQLFKAYMSVDRLSVLDEAESVMHVDVFPDLANRLLLPAILLFRRIEKWIEDFAFSNRQALLSLGLHELVGALARFGFSRDAARFSLKYTPLVRAACGDADVSTKRFLELTERNPQTGGSLELDCLRPGCRETAVHLCARCRLAHYCSPECADKDRYRHEVFCENAEGLPSPTGYNPDRDGDRSATTYGKAVWSHRRELEQPTTRSSPY